MAVKRTGWGTRMQRGDGATPEVFTSITGQTNISGPNQEHPVVSAMDNDEVTTSREIFTRRGYTSEGQITVDCNLTHNDTNQEAIEGDLEDTTAGNWRIIDRDATVIHTFAAFVTNVNREHPMAEMMTTQFVFQISGALTIA